MTDERTAEEQNEVAHHEAGHAALCVLNGIEIKACTIESTPDAAGSVAHTSSWIDWDDFDAMPEWQQLQHIEVMLAGRWAQREWRGRAGMPIDDDDLEYGATQDQDNAVDFASRLCPNAPECGKLIDWLELRTRRRVHEHWALVEVIAAALIERQTLSGIHVQQLADRLHQRQIASRLAAAGLPFPDLEIGDTTLDVGQPSED